MEIIYLNQTLERASQSVATIGMFDGVHRGHQRLISQVVETARRIDEEAVVVTFDRPPRQTLDATFRPQLLTTLDEKAAAIATLGVDTLAVLPFTRETAALSAEAFMRQVLGESLHVSRLITGYDNRFGRNRAEGFDDYVRYGATLGMTVERGEAELLASGGEPVSSSAVRRMLLSGDVSAAAQALGRPYRLTGRVVAGEHIGHSLGFPTANLEPDDADKLIPAAGAYAVWAMVGGRRLQAMMNVGMRPTFDGHRLTLEVHLLDFDGDVYGEPLTVAFAGRLRAEMRFGSPEALAAQLGRDRAMTEKLLNGENEI